MCFINNILIVDVMCIFSVWLELLSSFGNFLYSERDEEFCLVVKGK